MTGNLGGVFASVGVGGMEDGYEGFINGNFGGLMQGNRITRTVIDMAVVDGVGFGDCQILREYTGENLKCLRT